MLQAASTLISVIFVFYGEAMITCFVVPLTAFIILGITKASREVITVSPWINRFIF